jgi:hypothetical protein
LLEEKFAQKNENIREEVFEAMYIQSNMRGGNRLAKIEEFGYPPLIVVN